MIIGGIMSAVSWVSQLVQARNPDQVANAGDSPDAGHTVGPPPGPVMSEAIGQSLAKIGVGNASGISTSSIASSPADQAQALASFTQHLLAALHAQNTQVSATDGDSDGSDAAIKGGARHHRNPEADLQSLIAQLAAASDGSGSSNAASLSALQQSFQSLVGVLGASANDATLANFLQTLASGMQGVAPVGTVVSARV